MEYDSKKMKTMSRTSEQRSFAANQVTTHDGSGTNTKAVALPYAPSPRPFAAGEGSHSYAAFQQSSSSSSSTRALRHQDDALRQKAAMEADLRARESTINTRESAGTTTSVDRNGPVVTSYTVSSGPPGPVSTWQNASGASTKASTSGDYLDEAGNKVSYVKEMYTSSDPGKEFSMLTQEEKKIMDKPVEPGVISRHVTTKFVSSSSSSHTIPPDTTLIRLLSY